jgi:hypothetical protein
VFDLKSESRRSGRVFFNAPEAINVTDRRGLLAANRDAYEQFLNLISYDLEINQLPRAADRIATASQLQEHCGVFSSPRLEELLIQLGKSVFPRALKTPVSNRTRPIVWHITTEVESVGGHSRAIIRWIQNDPLREYNLLLTRQQKPIPDELQDAISRSGGRIHTCARRESAIEISTDIFKALDEDADVVVLQMYSGDISGLLPFCHAGGPRVITYNTADHKPFLGVSISDLVVEIRHSGQSCTQRFRGSDRTVLLPLLVDRGVPSTVESRLNARTRLGISANEVCVLSVGSEYKYRPIGNLDFLKAAERIANQNDRVRICVVGPGSTPAWDSLTARTQGRVRGFGRQEDILCFYEAADVYIEGFPFGSLTALLDARARGLPCVIAPKPVEPPFCSDSPGIADLAQPESTDAYIDVVGELCASISPDRQSMECPDMAMHWGHQWLEALENVFRGLPTDHAVYAPSMQEAPSWFLETFWSKFSVPSDSDAAENCVWSQLTRELGQSSVSERARLLPGFVTQAIESFLDRIHSGELRNTAMEGLIQSIRAVGQTSRCFISWRSFVRLILQHPRQAFRAFGPRLPLMSCVSIFCVWY